MIKKTSGDRIKNDNKNTNVVNGVLQGQEIYPEEKESVSIINASDIAFKIIKPGTETALNITQYPYQDFPISNEKIKKELVHKTMEENVVIANPTILNKQEMIFRTKLITPFENKFFFDHTYDHVPGMLVIEALRQFGTCITHIYFDVPMDSVFILNNLNTNFYHYIGLEKPVYFDVKVNIIKKKHGQLRMIEASGITHQDQVVLSNTISTWTILPQKMMAFLRKKD